MKRRDLKKGPKEGVRRLAKYLRLRVNDEMSDRQVTELVAWRLNARRMWNRYSGFVQR